MADNLYQRYSSSDSSTAGPLRLKDVGGVLYAVGMLCDSSGTIWDTVPVSLAGTVTIAGAVTNAGTFAVQAAQSGTWSLTNISGTISLPTGAATAAKQPALGVAGTPSADVITVQGKSGMTALVVDGSAVTQPVSGTVAISGTVNVDSELTTADLDTGAGTDTRAVVGLVFGASGGGTLVSTTNPLPIGDNGGSITVDGTVATNQSGTWTVQPGNTANTTAWLVTGTGGTFPATQSGAWNITNVSGTVSLPTGAATAAKQPALGTAGTASADVITIQGIASMTAVKVDGSAVTQPVSGTVTSTIAAGATTIAKAEDAASADADVGVPAMAVRKATPANTSGTDGDYEMLQISAGRLWASATIDAALPAGANAIGKLAANSGVTIGAVEIAAAQTLATVTTVTTVTTCSTVTTVSTLTGGGVSHDGAAGSVKPHLVGGFASAAAPTDVSTDGDATQAWFLRNGAQACVITCAGALVGGDAANGLDVDVTRLPALVAGTALIGKVGIDQTTVGTTNAVSIAQLGANTVSTGNGASGTGVLRVAQVSDGTGVLATVTNVATIGTSITPGTSAAHLGKAEDAAHASGDTGVFSLAVRQDTATQLAGTDGDYSPFITDANGRLHVIAALAASQTLTTVTTCSTVTTLTGGGVSHDGAAGSVKPHLIGGFASAAAPTDVNADGDAVQAWYLRSGAQVVQPSFGGTLATTGNGVSGGGVARVTLASDSTGVVGLNAGTNLIGKASSSDETGTIYNGTTALTPKFAKISTSSSGASTVVAAVTSKKIRVIKWDIVCNGAVNVKWQSHVTPTDLTGLYYFSANGGMQAPQCISGHFETVSGEALDINLSGAVAVGGCLTYVEV